MNPIAQPTRRERLIHLAKLLAAHERATGAERAVLAFDIRRIEATLLPPRNCITPPAPEPTAAALASLSAIPPCPPLGRFERLTVAPPRRAS